MVDSKVERWVIEIYPERGILGYGAIQFAPTIDEVVVSGWHFAPKDSDPVLKIFTPWDKAVTVPYSEQEHTEDLEGRG